MTKGLPGSGKSTWAKTQDAFRVNKDDIRQALHGGVWSKENERDVIKERDRLIRFNLKTSDVIVDDTNFASKHEVNLRKIAQECGADFEIKYFTDVSLEECIKRDAGRSGRAHVGESVIRTMWEQFLKPAPEVYNPSKDLEKAYCFDIDGTLAHMDGKRGPFHWHMVGVDSVDESVAETLRLLNMSSFIIILSGRDEVCRPETEKWLNDNDIPYNRLYMRPKGSMEKDTIVKKRLFDENIKDKFRIIGIFDDRPVVIRMWKSMGIKVFDCGDGIDF